MDFSGIFIIHEVSIKLYLLRVANTATENTVKENFKLLKRIDINRLDNTVLRIKVLFSVEIFKEI